MTRFFAWFTHYPSRKLEWAIAWFTLLLGVWLLLPAEAMNTRSYNSALFLMSETQWGLTYLTAGIVHNIALHINGRAAWTPLGRFVALVLNSQVFLALALNLWNSNPWGLGGFTYTFFSIGFCGPALVAAGLDCGRELKIWRARHGEY